MQFAALGAAILASTVLGAADAQTAKSKVRPAAPAASEAPQGDTGDAPQPAGWAARCSSASRDAPLECAVEQTAVLQKTG